MRWKLPCAMAVAVLGPLTFAAAASATTLGITSQPTGSTAASCASAVIAQLADDSTTPYHVPAGGGQITQWQTLTTGATPGAALTFAVLRTSIGSSSYTVVAADSVTIPNPLPSSGIATYPLSTPIQVQAGDTLALYSTSSGVNCFFYNGSTPAGDALVALRDSTPPSAGQTIMQAEASSSAYTLNVAATLLVSEDAAVTTTAGPAGASAGQAALLTSTVTNNGPSSAPITFTDNVPSGMKVDSAVAGNGNCSATGQTVICTITGLGSGQSAPVAVVATPAAAGSYTNEVSVAPASGFPDPNAANNSSSATLNVRLSVPAKCVVPRLKGVSPRLAKTILRDLGCRVRVRKAHSLSVRKGSLLKIKPRPGTYRYRRLVTLVISSGPKKK